MKISPFLFGSYKKLFYLCHVIKSNIMKYTKVIELNPSRIIKVTASLNDECKNGYDDFSIGADIYDTRGRRDEGKTFHNDKTFYYVEGCTNEETIVKYAPELMPVFKVAGTDHMGIATYPLLNGLYYLNQDDSFEYGCKTFCLTAEQGNDIKKFSDYHAGEFFKTHITNVTKPMADEAIKVLEILTKSTYKRACDISPQLFNDLHYKMVTDKNGWNVYKGIKKKEGLTYTNILNVEELSK